MDTMAKKPTAENDPWVRYSLGIGVTKSTQT